MEPSNSSSQYHNNHQSSSQYNKNTHQANHNQLYQHSQQNQNNHHRYQPPHQRQQTNQPSSSSTNQGDKSHRVLYQEQERLRAMIEKNEENTRNLNAQFGNMSAQMSNITEMLSRMSLPSTNNTNTNQVSSSSSLLSQPLPNPKGGLNAITLRSGTTLEKIPPRAMEDIHEEEVIIEAQHKEDEGDTKQEEEEVSLKEPKRKAIVDESVFIPFPSMVKKAKKTPKFDLSMLQVFKKVEVTILLLDVIQQILKSAAKFVLADKSVIIVVGIAEDVHVTIKDLVFPVDFYILEMPLTDSENSSSALLGRPFLKTFKFKLDTFTGTYSFEVGDKTIKFNLEEAMRYPPEEHSVLQCDVIDEVVAEIQREDYNRLYYPIIEGKDKLEDKQEKADEDELHDHGEKEPQLEVKTKLKPLPCHLKYAFLEDNLRFLIHFAPEDQKKTTFICPFGTFAYKKMSFGYLDNLAKVLERCVNTNLVLNFEKCHFMVRQGIVLGHVVSDKGISVDPAKKDVEFEFDDACKEAFEKLKEALTTAPIVRGPDWTQPFEIMCDASNHAVGAALAQREGKLPYIVAYSSKTLDAVQSNYTTTEKELLAIVHALDRFYGPFPNSSGYLYILLAVDYVSKWVEAIPTHFDDDNTAVSFIRNNIVYRYGLPRAIVSDQGTHFCNRKMEALLK
ncbi:uncharacterized protein LOC107615918 [Arachis ipaensis]|uniref:uncharacterized protein LOC107615918 n=1 Tax=Arachis ipaensis TaxID=130454 RepID=UPI0007AFA104|nr:uncharacterized protein LOC107615918 [Arachis ipaensis]